MVLPMIATIAITILNLSRIAISKYITFSGHMTPSFPFTCHIIRVTHRVQYLTHSFWPLYQEASSFYFDEKFDQTRSYAALRAADLDWIVGPGYSLGRVHSGEKP